jgi:putative ABC transport system permease protein
MIIPRLALRNLLGARIRTWLNVVVLSFSFVAIILTQGIYKGIDEQGSRAKIESEYGGGQLWQKSYDAYDPLSIDDAHDKLPPSLEALVRDRRATAILIAQGTLYPGGRVMPVLVKGIDPGQTILTIPSSFLDRPADNDIPAIIGTRMARSAGLKIGDSVTLRWRESGGSFNALDVRIIQVMNTPDPGIDSAQVWVPLERLRSMTRLEGQATVVVLARDAAGFPDAPGWVPKGLDFLLRDIKALVRVKSLSSTVLFSLLLLLAMLAIFDTQVLSIFRRRKEIGTMMAMGMTRAAVIRLFTLEGAFHAVLAALLAFLYGGPLALLLVKNGLALPSAMDSYGFAIGNKLFPIYGAGLVLGTTLIVLFVTTIVSYLPARRIARMKPTDALRGRLS